MADEPYIDGEFHDAGQTFWGRVRELIEKVFATRIQDIERIPVDPSNLYLDDVSSRRPMIVAAILAFLFHAVLFLVIWPDLQRELIVTDRVIRLRDLARPAGGGPPKPVKPPEPVKKPPPKVEKPKVLPIPDPTPQDPEPILEERIVQVDQVVDEVALDFNIGDITGPPAGRSAGSTGPGSGPSDGTGDSDGLEGVYRYGGGVRQPDLLRQTLPSYTDEAIKAKVQGTVLLQVVVRKDGSVDNFKVLKALGYGLDEKAIEEIANNWEFRPATLNGEPVDFLATIEVSFTLR